VVAAVSDLHRISETSLRRAAKGSRGKSVDVGRQATQGEVSMGFDIHLEVTRDSEVDCRQFFTRLEQALFERCTTVGAEGPYLLAKEASKPRRLQ
jgi:hypothetical protein